MAGLRVHMQLL
uniref:Uncharacterized protein n=1 Tax=Arundo donax TaxID=35708 RepID=A0A0A9H839_ARUDO